MSNKSQELPTSPHISIYSWQWTMIYSIAHRASGMLMGIGLLILTLGLVTLAYGRIYYGLYMAVMQHWLMQVVLFCILWAWLYHLCNGVRHLFWDLGIGLDIKSARRSGNVCFGLAFIANILIFFLI